MIKADLYGALARGYCSKKNCSKTVDPDLIEAMAEEILLLYCQKKGDFMGTENKIQECKCEDKNTDYHLTTCCQKRKVEERNITSKLGTLHISGELNIKDFQRDLEKIINCHSKENTSNTPDWIIASYLVRCLDVFDDCVNLRERYYGRQLIKEPIPIVKPSETLTALLCGPLGNIAIDCCIEEKRMLKNAIQKIKDAGL